VSGEGRARTSEPLATSGYSDALACRLEIPDRTIPGSTKLWLNQRRSLMRERNRRKTARRRAAFKKKQKKRRLRAAGRLR